MKKYVITGLIITLLIASTVQAISFSINYDPVKVEFTHTVFAEESTATWCPNCPMAADALYNIYQSGDYPFYYVALVDDMSLIAKDRDRDFSFGIFKIYAFPTVYFDGGDTAFIGRESTVALTEAAYRELIEQEGIRTPKQPLTMESFVIWNGDAKITVTVNVTNDGNLPYFGKIRSYVTEIVSRWDDDTGSPYHFALIDYAINNMVLLMPKKTKTITGNFDGYADHGNQTYPDITQDNIMVISSISHWIPHYRVGYQSQNYTQKYFARYVDQATAAIPN
ncbi:MAG: hypothetical protein A3K77_04840 [Euryarchaeota archaeon RBG_13_31_8]|nr:MAG: hypothetical protein A3K77_04840 [Euryarchaeota archaeon RBG_13_31_8]